jgi:hypothetical protein
MTKVHENKLRRLAARLGLRLHRSRARVVHLNDRGGWQLVEASTNTVVEGDRFDLTGEQVEMLLMNREAKLAHERVAS